MFISLNHDIQRSTEDEETEENGSEDESERTDKRGPREHEKEVYESKRKCKNMLSKRVPYV